MRETPSVPQPSCFAKHRLSARLLATALAGVMWLELLSARSVADGPNQPDPLFTAVRAAITSGRYTNSRVLGFHTPRAPFSELPPQGAILVGFDAGLGQFSGIEVVYALRAVYRTARGETILNDHGLFTDRLAVGNKRLKSKVVRTVRVRARAGYAVGGLAVRSGQFINGLAARFMRVSGTRLDPRQSSVSEWVGNRTGGSEASVTGGGDPVIGILGSEDDTSIKSLGLYFAPTAFVTAERQAQPPREVQAVQEPAEPAKAEAPAGPPVQVAPAAAPLPEAAKELAKGAPAVPGGWLPFAIFGAVAIPVFLVLLVAVGRKRPVPDDQPENADPAVGRRAGPPPVPRSACTSIRERHLPSQDPWPPPADDDLLDLVPAELAPEVEESGTAPAISTPVGPPASTPASAKTSPPRGPGSLTAVEEIPVVLPARRTQPPDVSRQPAPDVPRDQDPAPPPRRRVRHDAPAPALPHRDEHQDPGATHLEELAALRPPPQVVALGTPNRLFQGKALLDAVLDQLPCARALLPHPQWLAGGLGVGLGLAGLLLLLAIAVLPWEAKRWAFLGGALGLVLASGLILAAWQSFKHETRFAYAVYPSALACMQNGAWTVVPWEEVTEFRGHYNLGTRASMVVRDGLELRLGDHLLFPRSLYQEVEAHLFPALLQRTLAAFDAGKRVWFGPVGVSQGGLSYKGKAMAWDEIERIDLASPNAGTGVFGGLIGALAAVHVTLRIAKCGEPAAWYRDRQRWCEELFPTLPNRTVLLQVLQTLRPPHVPMTVSKAVWRFIPPVV